ncbi:dTDP-4-deoxyrhamnose-3,5-epimerase [Desulfamplus magnetovallimortis]|uniref:dTDP-4-dehydrorhamnose 3,5-epimerase n=1 Tax=Desulfamplus magnetovallimortis TaxID=1246637 RepID=A0A1W1HDI0_9BACT|nr:dTDP-4-dehydrorhamnose 3,5-epimerase [Desulfamplus magnetovallimortis]SLM30547.1 dTDP-4-deoxyrhamnose-3,5-epimerase [Desulfamplus magnetovallimortis]
MGTRFLNTELDGVLIVEPDVFGDSRGFFLETWHSERYENGGVKADFVQDNHSRSEKGVIRGLHYQFEHAQDKLVYAVRGTIFDVAVDMRKDSPTFGKWTGCILSEENRRQFFIPKGFAHGFSVLSDIADVTYKCSDFYAPGDEYGVLYSDPDLNIDWKVANPNVSDKDLLLPLLKAVPANNLFSL